MPIKINIEIKDTTLDAEFFDTSCARAIAGALPLLQGNEFYFESAPPGCTGDEGGGPSKPVYSILTGLI